MPLSREQFARIEAIYFDALALPRQERESFLAEECGDDSSLRHEVQALLRTHESEPIDQPLRAAMSEALSSATGQSFSGTSGRSSHPTGVRSGAPARRHIGTRIGHYLIEELIGEGGMGLVFRAHQEYPVRRNVALKLIRTGMDSRDVVARFESERQALALMDHPSVARVLDAGTTNEGQHYFVMEYVPDARPITTWCDDHRFAIDQRLALFIDVCEAVHHAHQRGVIHRDLKPTNMLMAEVDGKPVLKVIDFGVAKAIEPAFAALAGANCEAQMTHAGQLMGTPQYMSPEQTDWKLRDVDTRSDVYALGIVLYELVTGSPPIDRQMLLDQGLEEVLRIVRQVEAPRPSTRIERMSGDQARASEIAECRHTEPTRLVRQVRGELDWIICKALEKDRSRRYGTAAALAEDLRRCLANEPVLAGPPSTLYRARKFVRRHRIPVATGALLAVVLIAGVIGTSWQAVRARRAQRAALYEKALAEQHFADLRNLADTVIFEMDESLRNQGPTKTRKLMVATALKYLDALAAGAGGDRSLRQHVMRGYLRVGNTQYVREESGGGSLGDLPGALISYAKALRASRTLAGDDPSPSARDEVSRCLIYVGDTQAALEDYDAALAAYNESRQLSALLLSADANNRRAYEHLTTSLDRCGQVLKALGRTDEAIASYTQSLKLREQAVKTWPDNQRDRVQLAITRQTLQEFSDPRASHLENLQHMEQTLPTVRKLLEADPDNPRRQRDLAIGVYWLAELKFEQNRSSEVLVHLDEIVPIQRILLHNDPADVVLQDDLAKSLAFQGGALRQAGQVDKSIKSYEEALKLRRTLAASEGENAARRRIVSVLEDLANSYRDAGQFDNAVAATQEAVDLQRRRVGSGVGSPDRAALAAALKQLADMLTKAGRRDAARPILDELDRDFSKLTNPVRGVPPSQ